MTRLERQDLRERHDLAEDVKHHRQVAVTVLRPELAAALGPERFLREIEIAEEVL